jgi:hypothetical protein
VFTLISLIARMRTWSRPALVSRHVSRNNAPARNLAHELFSSAEARAGQDPREAEELREAARAWLSVVR